VSDPRLETQLIEQERRKLTRRLEEVERLCESTAPPSMFYGEMLKRLLESLAAPAGVVWTRTAQGNLQLQFQINLGEVGLDRTPETRQIHEELLRYAFTQTQPGPLHLMPRSGVGPAQEGQVAAGNPTDYLLLLVPIVQNEQISGLIEVWQNPNRPPSAVPGFLQYMALMANLASRYQRHQMLGQMVGQQQLWTQLEAFARQIHSSLNPVEVGYHVANEGRRLIECDRLAVGVRYGSRVEIEAVSGSDVVEKRSNEIHCLRRLCQAVLDWGEKLVFSGARDDTLPPKVRDGLDRYLAERASKLLVITPLRDEREGEEKDKDRKKPRTVLVMECFDPPPDQASLQARLEVVGRHAGSALYNAVEHRRIPMRFLWMPLAKVQEGLGGKTKAIATAVLVGLSLFLAVMIFVPYPLKMETPGQLYPQVRRILFAPTAGVVKSFKVEINDRVGSFGEIAQMFAIDLESKLNTLEAEKNAAEGEYQAAIQQSGKNDLNPGEKVQFALKAVTAKNTRDAKEREIKDLLERTHSVAGQHGAFRLVAPQLTQQERNLIPGDSKDKEWTVLTANFREEWTGKEAKPSDPILRLGVKEGPWEIELKIPQKHIGQIQRALHKLKENETLEVDFLLRSDPTRRWTGRLSADRIAGEANPNRDDNNESEPVVLAYVRIDGDDIPEAYRLPRDLLLSGAEVHAKVRCGDQRMGYSLFYGVWEFVYEKVIFFLF
jgi:hypothetical protein